MINIYGQDYRDIIENVVKITIAKHQTSYKDIDVEITLVDQEEIRQLNKRTRNIDKVTDVLSFQNIVNITFPLQPKNYPTQLNPQDNSIMLGEIFICLDKAIAQANEYGHTIAREIGFLTCHGLLHLLGYNHNDDAESDSMESITKEIMEEANLPREINDGNTTPSDTENTTPSDGNTTPSDRNTTPSDGNTTPSDGSTTPSDTESTTPSDTASTEQSHAEYIASKPEALVKDDFKSGFVAIMGKPNAGKSTLINTLVGEKVAIVSWKPQTTRNKILGIYNEPSYQIIFIDTPGLHKPKNTLGKYMMRVANSALDGIDCVLYLIDGEKSFDQKDKDNITSYLDAGMKVIAVVNKVDRVTKEKVFGILTELKDYPLLQAVVPISAWRGRNIEPLKEEIKKLLTDNIKYYDKEQYTDKNMRFIASEIIREKALRLLNMEVPYGIGVDITKYTMRESGDIIDIDADIICEKPAHKPIILGKGGSMIKTIGTYARQDLEKITGCKIFLTLFVKVRTEWRENNVVLKELGYDN